jgi:hypothetical protein
MIFYKKESTYICLFVKYEKFGFIIQLLKNFFYI